MSNLNNQRIQLKVEEVKNKFIQRIQAIQEAGAARIQKLQDESPEPSAFEAIVRATFDVKWKTTSIKLDIPTFRTEKETMKFNVPEMKMEMQSIKFEVPATRMVRTCLFKKPEVTVRYRGLRPPKVETRMTCVWGDKPEVYMKPVEIKTDVPKFTSKTVSIVFDKPTVTMETREIKFDIPQFFLRQLNSQFNEQKHDIEQVAQEMTSEIAKSESEMQAAIQTAVGNELQAINNELVDEFLKERAKVSAYYDDAISRMKSTINILKQNNAVAEVQRLENELGALVKTYTDVLAEIDRSLEAMNTAYGEEMNLLSAA